MFTGGSGRSRDDTVSHEAGTARTVTRRTFLATGAALSLGSLAGCLGSASDDNELTEVTFRHRYARTDIGAGAFDTAIEMGVWEDEGLDVSFKTSSGGQAAAKSVANGKDMFGNGGVSAPLGLSDQGLVCIGQLYDPLGGILSLSETGIETWADLEGKTVGQFPFGGTAPVAKAAMREEGVDLSEITFKNLQPGTDNRLLIEGEIDASISYFVNDVAWFDKRGYTANVLKPSNVLDHLGVMLFTRQEAIENQPDVVDSFVRGWLRSYQIFANQIDKVIEIYKPKAVEGWDEEIQRESLPNYYSAMVPSKDIGQEKGKGWIQPSRMDETVTIFENADVLEDSVTPEDTYTNEFIDQNRDIAVESANEIYDRLKDFDVGPNHV